MGMPKKPKPGFWESFWEHRSQKKHLRIRDLPKLKLMRWTAYFFFSSVGLFMFFGGPHQLYHQERLLEDARALEKAGYLRPTDKSRVGNSQAFSNNYGFDYAKEQKSREE